MNINRLTDTLFWILLILTALAILWFLTGKSPTTDQIILGVLTILTMQLFRLTGTAASSKTEIKHINKDIKEINNKLEKIEKILERK